MSNRERAMQLLEAVPDYKIEYVIAYLQGVTAGNEISEKIPNDENNRGYAGIGKWRRYSL